MRHILEMTLEIRKPILAIGLGGAGSKLATKASNLLNCDHVLISNDVEDLKTSSQHNKVIKVDTGAVINPTINLVRAATYSKIDQIREHVSGYQTVFLFGNLAGKVGCAIAPIVSEVCKAEDSKMISFAIMPFGYEKSQLFSAGVALRRLRESSTSTIVLDNDSILESNPDLTPKECYGIADTAILYVLGSIEKSDLESSDNILVASRDREMLEVSLRDALKTMYGSTNPESIKHSILYVVNGENIPTGMLNTTTKLLKGALATKSAKFGKMTSHATADTRVVSTTTDRSRIVMLSTVQDMSKFERYDPLGAIPEDKMLDWTEPECSIDCQLADLYQLE